MGVLKRHVAGLALCALFLAVGRPASSQSLTATITGRVADTSGGILPGVAVTISSPSMIGGERTTVTDGEGVYRLTLLPPGEYRVVFALSGFATLTIEKVLVTPGSTMTTNGKLELAALETSVTVVSQTPAIDLKATDIATNWDSKKLEDLPYARGIRGLALLLPGLTSTQFDVGGNTVGGSTTTGANSYGRTGDELARYDGAVWDQHFGDYDTYEQVQASTAAKGAEAQSPGLTLNFLVKSGSNTFHGTYLGAYESGAFQGSNVSQALLDRGYLKGNNQFTRYNDFHADLGGPIIHDKLWFYGGYGRTYSGLRVPGFISIATGQQVVFFTNIDSETIKLTYQATRNGKLEFSELLSRKYQPVPRRQPVRPARSHRKPEQPRPDWSRREVEPDPHAAHDDRRGREPVGILVAGRSVDHRRAARRSDDDADARRLSRAEARAGPMGMERRVELVHRAARHEPRSEVRRARL